MSVENKKSNSQVDVIRITKALVVMLGVMTLAAVAFSKFISEYIVYCCIGELNQMKVYFTMGVIFLAAIAAFALLYFLLKLLNNLSKGKVFVKDNITNLKAVATGLIAIAAVGAIGSFLIDFTVLFISFLMLFVALIVICVELVFKKAIEMKDELDLTV